MVEVAPRVVDHLNIILIDPLPLLLHLWDPRFLFLFLSNLMGWFLLSRRPLYEAQGQLGILSHTQVMIILGLSLTEIALEGVILGLGLGEKASTIIIREAGVTKIAGILI